MSKKPLTEEEVLSTMKRWQEAFEAGDKSFFEYFADDVSIFTLSTPTRIDGREVYREGFEDSFLGRERKSQILSPEVKVLSDDSAMMTFHNRILIDGQSANIRGTVIFARDRGGKLKCVHMHNSPLTQPGMTARLGADLEGITVLEERVASAVAMVGTPK